MFPMLTEGSQAQPPQPPSCPRPAPRVPLLACLSPSLSGLSSLRSTTLCLAPGRVDGAAASRWAREEPRRGVAAGGGRHRWGALARGRCTNAVCISSPLFDVTLPHLLPFLQAKSTVSQG